MNKWSILSIFALRGLCESKCAILPVWTVSQTLKLSNSINVFLKMKRAKNTTSDKRKQAKVTKRQQVFKHEYSDQYPVIQASERGCHYAYCKVCKSHFSVAAGGIYDCAVHVGGKRHKSLMQVTSNQMSMNTFVSKTLTDYEHQTISAELLFSRFIVEHNLPLAVSDHATKLFRQMFPDSQIAKSFQCGRTKMTALVQMQADSKAKGIAKDVASNPFTLATDGSNDKSDKFYPIILRYIDSAGDICESLLDVPTVDEPSCTGENIFNLMNAKLRANGLQWENCLALGADNANVMAGDKNGVIGRIHRVSPNTYFAGCPCHLIAIAAKNAAKTLPMDISERLVDIYYFLKHSAKRQGELSDIKHDHGVRDLRVLKYCPTRWLSLRQCLVRLLELWAPLREFFNKQHDSKAKKSDKEPERGERCKTFLNSHSARAYCHFLIYILEVFDRANQALQFEKPLLHKSRRVQLDLFRTILLKFLKPSAFRFVDILNLDKPIDYYKPSIYLISMTWCKKDVTPLR